MVDFDFLVDITHAIIAAPIHWSVSDPDPAYRGATVRQVDAPNGRRNATRAETRAFRDWRKARRERGLPPWLGVPAGEWRAWNPGPMEEDQPLKSSRTLRQWADHYCASKKLLKELVYEKVGPSDCQWRRCPEY